jgi:hypothetical protein
MYLRLVFAGLVKRDEPSLDTMAKILRFRLVMMMRI